MGVGALSYFKLSFEPYLLLVLFLSLFTITGLVWALSTFKDSAFFNETPIRFFVYGCLSLIIGFTVAKIRTELLSTPMLSCSIKDVVVIGTIKDIEHPPYKKGNKRRIIINNLSYQKVILHYHTHCDLTSPIIFLLDNQETALDARQIFYL